MGDTEIWEIINITADAHPMHTHLASFQLLNRQAFHAAKWTTVYAACTEQPPMVLLLTAWGLPIRICSGTPTAPSGATPPSALTCKGSPQVPAPV